MDYFSFQWHITDSCDQRCRHCYIFAEGHPKLIEMPMERCRQVVGQCEEMAAGLGKLPFFIITGGDPILHRHFWDILELLHQRNHPFVLLGNPFHLTDEVAARLVALGCVQYQVSLDGMRETHDAIRKPGSFDATLEALRVMKRNGLESAVMATVSATNIDEMPEVCDTVVAHGADVFAFGRYCPTSEEKSTHLSPTQYRDFLERMWRKFEEHKDSGTTFSLKDHLWTLFLYEKGLFTIPEEAEKGEVYDGCHCGDSHVTITPTGEVMACRRFESRVGNLFRQPLSEIWESDGMEAYRHYERFEKCADCELAGFCRGCPAVAHGTTGSFYAPDPQCWKQ